MDVHKYWVEPVFKSLPRDARIKLVANVEAAMMRTGTATKITLSEYASTDEYAYIRCLEDGDNDMTEKVYAAFQGLSVDEKKSYLGQGLMMFGLVHLSKDALVKQ